MMVGRDLSSFYKKEHRTAGEPPKPFTPVRDIGRRATGA
jgi:hypothetical protein